MRLIFEGWHQEKLFHIYFWYWIIRSKFWWVLYIIVITSITNLLDRLVCFFCLKPSTLQDHSLKHKWRYNVKVSQECVSFLSRFSFIETSDSQDSRRKEGTIFIPVCHFHQLSNIQTFISSVSCEITMLFSFCKTKLKKNNNFTKKYLFAEKIVFIPKKVLYKENFFTEKKLFLRWKFM